MDIGARVKLVETTRAATPEGIAFEFPEPVTTEGEVVEVMQYAQLRVRVRFEWKGRTFLSWKNAADLDEV